MNKKILVLCFAVMFFLSLGIGLVAAQIVTFTKSDWGSEQDCITPNVCLTRWDQYPLYNSVYQTPSDVAGAYSNPTDTEWAIGTCDSPGPFGGFVETVQDYTGWYFPGIIGVDMCLHLITDDLYFDINFNSWTCCGLGGGFSYTRTEFTLIDTDGDSVDDSIDNCINIPNLGQIDSDSDGFGNICDTDFDNDCVVDEDDLDLVLLFYGELVPPAPPVIDTNSDGEIDIGDLFNVLITYGKIPGPSALNSTCQVNTDGDGVSDYIDNCVNIWNPGQEDADGDGIGDVCDYCMYDPENDADGDTVCGDVDNCPTVANPDQEDTDSDGVGNLCDNCPSEDSTGFDIDSDGCIDTIEGLTDIINTLEDDVLSDETKNSLVSKVDNALKSTDKDQDQAAINQLQAFINEIEAQRGKKISEEAADILIGYANNIIKNIQAG